MLTVLYIEPCTLYHEQPLKKEKKRGGDKVKEEREREICSLCCTLNTVLCTLNSLVFRKILMQDYLCACVCEREREIKTERHRERSRQSGRMTYKERKREGVIK